MYAKPGVIVGDGIILNQLTLEFWDLYQAHFRATGRIPQPEAILEIQAKRIPIKQQGSMFEVFRRRILAFFQARH